MIRFAIAAAALAIAAPASAQQASYCGGAVVSNAFYANVSGNGRTSSVEYHGAIQNMDPQRRKVTATLVQVQQFGPHRVVRMIGSFELNSYEQKDITLVTLGVNNPSGSGAPNAMEVGRQIQMSCRYG